MPEYSQISLYRSLDIAQNMLNYRETDTDYGSSATSLQSVHSMQPRAAL